MPTPSATLVPELAVTDLARSLAFWRDLVGFEILYDRPEDGFAYLGRDRHDPTGRNWLNGPFRTPLGNGINLQVAVAAVAPILDRLERAGWPLVMAVEDKWYRRGDREVGQRQFVVADPDGYVLRLAQPLGLRALAAP